MARSNYADIEAALMSLVRCCELDQPGPDGQPTLADGLFNVDVAGIERRSIAGQHGPNGASWAPNAPEYSARKGGKPVGVLTGEMLSPVELEGNRTIGSDRALMNYGKSGWAQQKATWFEIGNSRQPPREFYASDPEDDPEKVSLVNRQIERAIDRLEG